MVNKLMQIKIVPRKIMIILVTATALQILLHVIAQYILIEHRAGIEGGFINGVLSLFDMGSEMSIPTYYSQVILLAASVAAAFVAYDKWVRFDRWRYHWLVVSGALLWASVDEGATLHEKMSLINLPSRLGIQSDFLVFSWVLPAILIIIVLGLVLFRFWWDLPGRTRWLFAISAIVFLGGAIGMEMISSRFISIDLVNYPHSFTYRGIFWAIEEGMEQLGVLLIIYTILDYARGEAIVAKVTVENE